MVDSPIFPCRTCVKLMQIPVDGDALHALMRLTLRLTRDYSLAKLFAEKGGVTALLKLDEDCCFGGYKSLVTLIFRHIMEEPSTLRTAIEKVRLNQLEIFRIFLFPKFKSKTLIYFQTIRARIFTDVQPYYRELFFLMRHSEAGICRNPELYLEIAQKVLRVEYSRFSSHIRTGMKYIVRF